MHAEHNPYAPGAGVAPPFLAGRDSELELIDEVVAAGSCGRPTRAPVFTGLRGVGKTVLLRRLIDRATDAGWLVVEVDGQSGPSGRACSLRQIATGLALAARRLQRPRPSTHVLAALSAIQRFGVSLGVLSLDLTLTGVGPDRPAEPSEADLQETIADIVPALIERGIALLIAIDEVQETDLGVLGALLTAQHGAVGRRWPVLVAGAGLPNAPAVLCEARSYAGRAFVYRRIEPLPPEDTALALRTPASTAGVRWDDGAVDAVVEASAGYPSHLQTFAAHAWFVALDGGRITLADARAGIDRGQRELDHGFFAGWWGRVTGPERRYLAAVVATGHTEPLTDRVEAELGPHGDWGTVRRALLAGSTLYVPAPGRIALTIPRLDTFVLAHGLPDEPD